LEQVQERERIHAGSDCYSVAEIGRNILAEQRQLQKIHPAQVAAFR
jgi:hypothetical protein